MLEGLLPKYLPGAAGVGRSQSKGLRDDVAIHQPGFTLPGGGVPGEVGFAVLVVIGDRPQILTSLHRLANDGLGLGAAEAIHEPDGGLVLAGVNPEEVVGAVAVEVAAALELPLGVSLLAIKLGAFFDRSVFEGPGDDFSGVVVVPEEVGRVVVVEVAGAGELPDAIVDGSKLDGGGGLGVVHQPEEVLAGGGVAPGEVCVAIIVEVR